MIASAEPVTSKPELTEFLEAMILGDHGRRKNLLDGAAADLEAIGVGQFLADYCS